MKRILALAVLAFATTSLTATAQTYGTITLSSVPTSLVGAIATNCTSVIDIRNNKNVAVQLKFQSDTTGTDPVAAVFIPSIDGTTFDTTKVYRLTCLNGTAGTAVVATTNWDFAAFGYVKLAFVTNAAAGSAAITNLSVKVALKPTI